MDLTPDAKPRVQALWLVMLRGLARRREDLEAGELAWLKFGQSAAGAAMARDLLLKMLKAELGRFLRKDCSVPASFRRNTLKSLGAKHGKPKDTESQQRRPRGNSTGCVTCSVQTQMVPCLLGRGRSRGPGVSVPQWASVVQRPLRRPGPS